MNPARLVHELRRRGVIKGAAFYIIAAWATLQVADLALPGLNLPESAIRYVWIGAFLCFPLAIFFTWRYEITRDGIVRTPPALGEGFDSRLRPIDWALIAALLGVACLIAHGVVSGVRHARAPGVVTLAPPPEGRLAIAVLPFRNMSGDPEQEYFSDVADILTWTDWNWPAAGVEWRRALALNPGNADTRAYYSHYLLITGQLEEGMKQIEAAVAMDPFNLIFLGFYAVARERFGRYDEVLQVVHKILQIMRTNIVGLSEQWVACEAKGTYAEAFASVKAYLLAIYGNLDPRGDLDRTFATKGYAAAMEQLAQLLVAHAQTNHVLPLDIAFLYRSAGNWEQTIAWLERGYAAHDPAMPYLAWPSLDPLRSDPRFKALLRKMNLPE